MAGQNKKGRSGRQKEREIKIGAEKKWRKEQRLLLAATITQTVPCRK